MTSAAQASKRTQLVVNFIRLPPEKNRFSGFLMNQMEIFPRGFNVIRFTEICLHINLQEHSYYPKEKTNSTRFPTLMPIIEVNWG